MKVSRVLFAPNFRAEQPQTPATTQPAQTVATQAGTAQPQTPAPTQPQQPVATAPQQPVAPVQQPAIQPAKEVKSKEAYKSEPVQGPSAVSINIYDPLATNK